MEQLPGQAGIADMPVAETQSKRLSLVEQRVAQVETALLTMFSQPYCPAVFNYEDARAQY
jgi:hypothetical protein